ncbi:hypothetical protein P691DRAFT_715442 [Macrolepiota fuliginosa MF-IS2]|uniref:Nephrocystin 3-like N-terminal domain-containing protein n=1 Tax=Macrolepiota fuliginosa MF-IS2 TaxID=1400762 RepID=A0A9P5WZU2_9AGAR|nr:hypothetical protein P691DRAFT_715442 [Macrolepiota fuliginosa MF-IS2]
MSNAGLLQGAHGFVLNNPHLNDNSTHVNIHSTIVEHKCLGLKMLLDASMPDAFYDSSARDPPPSCHPGTRHDFIDTITSWGLGASQHTESMLWMYGPAGVGKSAIAQTCSEHLAEKNKLGAALFFSHSVGLHKRDDPHRLFPSLAYQIATKSKPFGDILDKRIQDDPTLVTKSMKEQFQELLVKPLSQLGADAAGVVDGLVVAIDGLDECGKGPEMHCDIIKIVATSVRNQTTPFRWAFFSRPETHIVGSFTTHDIRSLLYHLKIQVSRKIDNEITLYLTDGLREIQLRNGLPDSWLSERGIGVLVNLSGGLFIYAATVIRFVGSHESLGPVDQLRAVIALARDNKRTDLVHPLSELDLFYTLIMRCVPSGILLRIQAILLLTFFTKETDFLALMGRLRWKSTRWIANIIGISEPQFRNACGSLHSVLELDSTQEIKFYHASFMEFLRDPNRSGEFCMYSRLDSLRLELLQRLNKVHSRRIGSPGKPIHINITWPIPESSNLTFYRLLVDMSFSLCHWGHPLDSLTSEALFNFQFCMIPFLWYSAGFYSFVLHPPSLKKNVSLGALNYHLVTLPTLGSQVPADFRHRIVRRSYNPIVYLHKPRYVSLKDIYVLGSGENKVLCWADGSGIWRLSSYPTWFNFRYRYI